MKNYNTHVDTRARKKSYCADRKENRGGEKREGGGRWKGASVHDHVGDGTWTITKGKRKKERGEEIGGVMHTYAFTHTKGEGGCTQHTHGQGKEGGGLKGRERIVRLGAQSNGRAAISCLSPNLPVGAPSSAFPARVHQFW